VRAVGSWTTSRGYVLARDSDHLFDAWVSHAARDVGLFVSSDQARSQPRLA
jgi:hypothetical protein